MKIRKLRLINFKRFTDLTIKDIDENARLVLIVGPNGCGKSSLFDAIYQWYMIQSGRGYNQDNSYFQKDQKLAFNYQGNVEIDYIPATPIAKNDVYIRTAYRHEPDFNITSIAQQGDPTETIRFNKIIEGDVTVSSNYMRLVYDTMAGVFNKENQTLTVATLRDRLIGEIRISMRNVFGDLVLEGIGNPASAGTFLFDKGSSKSYQYKNLSGGEKAAFDLLLDLHSKKNFYPSAVYLIDEIETHLHTSIQGKLLREIMRILPPDAQLWLTTHSLGVIRAAHEMAKDDSRSVNIVDFEAVDPDVPQELTPSSIGRVSWEKMMSIALGDLSERVAPEKLVVCEGSSVGTRRKDFDAEIYNRILGWQNAGLLFVSGGNSAQVQNSGVSIQGALDKILPKTIIKSLCDRDDKSPQEVSEFESKSGIVLSQRNLESYLFADDVLEALCKKEQKQHLYSDCLKIKSDSLAASVARGNAADDIKSAAGQIFVELKKTLGLTRCGNDTNMFMRDTLANLIKPGMSTYNEMETSITKRV